MRSVAAIASVTYSPSAGRPGLPPVAHSPAGARGGGRCRGVNHSAGRSRAASAVPDPPTGAPGAGSSRVESVVEEVRRSRSGAGSVARCPAERARLKPVWHSADGVGRQRRARLGPHLPPREGGLRRKAEEERRK